MQSSVGSFFGKAAQSSVACDFSVLIRWNEKLQQLEVGMSRLVITQTGRHYFRPYIASIFNMMPLVARMLTVLHGILPE